ncbi:N-acetylmuramoyl-L-alanine amidase [Arthrobacter sp. TMP15]|uniref:N-acetylmuramoyl-L-alanine amidase n=1 Tax=Arthrobacter sp. TMP15 TaxID=3140789 RepID=UPI0031BA60F5
MVAEHITNLPSSKSSGKRSRTQMLVVHSAETPLAAGYAASVTNNWLNRSDVEASINAFFGPDTTVRSVNTDHAAWHATWANGLSVGYEFTGYAALTRAQWLTAAGKNMLDRAGREMAADAKIYGIPLRYLTTAEVNAIANGNQTIKGIATHAQIDPANRTDPGAGFPFDVLMGAIKRYSGTITPPPASPQGGTITPIQEDELSAKDVAEIKQHINALLINTYTSNGVKNLPGVRPILVENQKRMGALAGKLDAQTELIKQLAKGQGVTIDYAEVEAAAAAGVAKAIADGVDLDATVTIKKDAQ